MNMERHGGEGGEGGEGGGGVRSWIKHVVTQQIPAMEGDSLTDQRGTHRKTVAPSPPEGPALMLLHTAYYS